MPHGARPAIVCLGLVLLGPFLLIPSGSDGRSERLPPSSEPDLPAILHLRWVRDLPAPRPAWPDQPRMPFDAAPRPAIAGNAVLVPSTVTDDVTAFDTETGRELWRFATEGPVRFAPAVWNDRAFVASDDGHLYCLDAADGHLLWQVRGGPSGRKVLGNGRLISTWPARGGPVVADGTVYFAAGVWPFMGIFIHALNAQTGEVAWSNDGDGSTYRKQPHQADSFGGVAPQGTLAVAGDRLLVPGGRSVPACLDRKTGKLLHYRLADNSKIGGGSEVLPDTDLYLNGGAAFDLKTGDYLGPSGEPAVVAGHVLYSVQGSELRAFDLKGARVTTETTNRTGKTVKKTAWRPRTVASVPVPRLAVLIRAGHRLYGAAEGQLLAYDLPLRANGAGPSWQMRIVGRPAQIVAGGGHLFVSTREGKLYCFGGEEEPPVNPAPIGPIGPIGPNGAHDEWSEKAQNLLSTAGVHDGYCVAWGVGNGRLIQEIVRHSQLHVVVVEPDEERVADFRCTLAAAGLYGTRVAVLHDNPESVDLPPYLASLMIAEDPDEAGIDGSNGFLKKAFAVLRPYGGVACFPASAPLPGDLAKTDSTFAQAKLRTAGTWTLLTREGPLPGSGDWTHEHADAANTPDIFGTWLSYSAQYDILVESGRVARDTLSDEPKRIRAWQARDGKPLWVRKDYVGPAMIHGDIILKDKSACDLRTGAPVLHDDPLTGEKVEWKWERTYGCNTPAASENLLTFRSGAAGYCDLTHDAGTGNLGGFRSGCTNNLIVADGLLTAADYTRTVEWGGGGGGVAIPPSVLNRKFVGDLFGLKGRFCQPRP